jgi:DNA-binding response OmpR family regulator
VGLTGDGSDEDARYFTEHGANAVMTKPFDLDDFNKIVQRFFE